MSQMAELLSLKCKVWSATSAEKSHSYGLRSEEPDQLQFQNTLVAGAAALPLPRLVSLFLVLLFCDFGGCEPAL